LTNKAKEEVNKGFVKNPQNYFYYPKEEYLFLTTLILKIRKIITKLLQFITKLCY